MKTSFKFFTQANLRSKLYLMMGLAFLISISFIKSNGTGGLPQSDGANGGLFLPGGFSAVVVADSVGKARHLAVNRN